MRIGCTCVVGFLFSQEQIFIIDDFVDYIFKIICLFIFLIFFYLIVFCLKIFEKNDFWNNIWFNLCKNKYKIMLFTLLVGIFLKFIPIILFISSPFVCYLIIKKFFSDIKVFQDLFLNFKNIKFYSLVYFILEMILSIIFILIVNSLELWLLVYVNISCLLWYLPFLLLSYLDKNKMH